jgi:hypothetical protein
MATEHFWWPFGGVFFLKYTFRLSWIIWVNFFQLKNWLLSLVTKQRRQQQATKSAAPTDLNLCVNFESWSILHTILDSTGVMKRGDKNHYIAERVTGAPFVNFKTRTLHRGLAIFVRAGYVESIYNHFTPMSSSLVVLVERFIANWLVHNTHNSMTFKQTFLLYIPISIFYF